jgi:peptidoglycan/xylan/chitin deacetylase (PgdA/CDA1 family)
MYHRVSDQRDYLGQSVSPSHFDRHLGALKRHAEIVPLRGLLERLAGGAPLRHDLAAVTFDDGYRDNHEFALPILEKHGVTATLFVTTDFADGVRRPAGERLRAAFKTLWERRLPPAAWKNVDAPEADRLVRAALEDPGSLPRLARLAFALPKLEQDRADRLLDDVEHLAAPVDAGPSPMLDWAQVRVLAERCFEIGSHSVSHAIFSRIPRAAAERELAASKARIEAQIGRRVLGFAFPNGGKDDFTAADCDALRRTGYEYACTAVRGVNRRGHFPFGLLRIGVGDYGTRMFSLKLALGR